MVARIRVAGSRGCDAVGGERDGEHPVEASFGSGDGGAAAGDVGAAAADLLAFGAACLAAGHAGVGTSDDASFGTILADPPWRFSNRTGKMAPEHHRLSRYGTMTLQEIKSLPVARLSKADSHLYLWVPNALLPEGLAVMESWGFTYKTNLIWYKVRKDGGPDGRGVGFYFRNVTEVLLFGVRGSLRTREAGRRQTNIIVKRKREHSRKPDEQYDLVERCSPGPYLELFARHARPGWAQWGDEMSAGAPESPRASSIESDGTSTPT